MTTRTRHVVALLPWGDVFEEFLDPLGLDLQTFAETGSGGWLWGYAKALKHAGVDAVIILVSRDLKRPSRWINKPTGVAVIGLPVPKGCSRLKSCGARLGPIGQGIRELASYASIPARSLHEVLTAEGCDSILVQEYESPRFDVLVQLGRRWSLPVFATFQGGISWGWRCKHPMRRRAINSAAALFIGPATEVERVQRTWNASPDRITRIFNPLDTDLWWPEGRAAAREELGLSRETLLVVWHGRVEVRRKGLDVLTDAWQRLLAIAGRETSAIQPHLLLIGSGQDVQALRDLLANLPAATWTWIERYEQDRSILRRLLSAGDIAVLPSRHEGFPVAPLEAMACGLPVVATDAPGMADILAAGEASGGVLVPREDPAALASALWKLATSPADRATLAAAARRNIQTRFSLRNVGQQLAAAIYGDRGSR